MHLNLARGQIRQRGFRMRYVYHGDGRNSKSELRLTDDDILWLCRAFIGEHGRDSFNTRYLGAFVWCMINRYMLHPGNRYWKSFRYMLRRFSQPINPRWMRGGDLARKNKDSPMCSEKRLDRREKLCSLAM